VAQIKIYSMDLNPAAPKNLTEMARSKQTVRMAQTPMKPRLIAVEIIPNDLDRSVLFQTSTFELFTGDKYGHVFEWDEENHVDYDVFMEQTNIFKLRYEAMNPIPADFYHSKFRDTLTPGMECFVGLDKIRFSTSPAEYFIWRGVEQWMTKTGIFDGKMNALKEEDPDWKENLFFLSVHEAYKCWDIVLGSEVICPSEYSPETQSKCTASVSSFKDVIMSHFSFAEDKVVGCFCVSKMMEVIKKFSLNAMEAAAWIAVEASISVGYRFQDCYDCKTAENFEFLVEKEAEAVITLLQDNTQFHEIYRRRLANIKKFKMISLEEDGPQSPVTTMEYTIDQPCTQSPNIMPRLTSKPQKCTQKRRRMVAKSGSGDSGDEESTGGK
jgi:hypothetical protein